ncbi:MAG: hypothetical protein WC657_05670 [Candidatus Paceibacterota bacterium]
MGKPEGKTMASKKGIHWSLTVPRKRERNAFAIAVAKGEASRGARINSKKVKNRNKKTLEWMEEDWGDDEDQGT